jgi:RNA polymerase primary sigma factor
MPRVSTPRTDVVAELGEQLRFGSRKTLIRHLERIEELAVQIEDEGVYPEDFVVFRISGYRPEVGTPRMLPGAALRGDLSALAERLSESAGLTEADVEAGCETVASLTARWGVSRKTLERYRRLGLIARRVDLGAGRRVLVFGRAGVEAFERRHAERLGKAGRFGRMSERDAERLVRWAARYRGRLGWTLNRVAQRLAARTGRSPEGVRRVLRRADRGRPDPVFPEPGPPTARERLLAVRAVARGIEPAVLAERTGRRKSAVLRALHEGRADLLRSLALPAAGQGEPGAATRPASARAGLGVVAPADLAALLAQMRERVEPRAEVERDRAAAYRALVGAAGARIAALPASGAPGPELDAIETMLRWAAMLKAALVRSQLRLAIETLEQRLGGPLDALAPARATVLAMGLIGVIGEGVERFDPKRGGRLAAPVSLGLGRWCAAVRDVSPAAEPGRAARRTPAGVVVPDWTRRVAPWQAWLAPDSRLGGVLARLEEPDRVLLARRFGLDGERPETLDALAAASGRRAVHLARAERRALRLALGLARDSGEPRRDRGEQRGAGG